MSTKAILVMLFLVLAGSATWFFGFRGSDSSVSNFEECVAAGNPVMESHPRQCAANGQTFTEELDEDDEKDAAVQSEDGVEIRLEMPLTGDTISSPQKVTGEVPGNWSFEASFTVELYDADGELLDEAVATLTEDWMTTDYVPFEAELEFAAQTKGSKGTLRFVKANASGLAENDDHAEIEVVF